MRIDKCCDRVFLPGGERKWRRMARLAKYPNRVKVRAFNKHDEEGSRLVLGSMSAAGRVITIRVNHNAPHVVGVGEAAHYDPLATFGHELGHFILKQRGREYTSAVHQSDAEYRSNAVERACDRYSRLLRSRT